MNFREAFKSKIGPNAVKASLNPCKKTMTKRERMALTPKQKNAQSVKRLRRNQLIQSKVRFVYVDWFFLYLVYLILDVKNSHVL